MSSPFSYELDERQIKLMLQDVELACCEQAWQKFDELSTVDRKTPLNITVPKLNVGISRSIIIPIFFILLIAGFSSILFSFVDFKKKPEVIKEIPYQAPPKKIVTKTKPVVVPITKPIAAPADSTKNTTPQLSTTLTIATPTLQSNKITAIKSDVKPIEVITQKKNDIVATTSSIQTTTNTIRRKKKKEITEEIQTISLPNINLNEGSTEPELELK